MNYEESLNQVIRLAEALPPSHLARFVVDIIAQLDMSKFYRQYSNQGGMLIAPPQVLLGLLFYGYATGVFSSREIEKATYESIPFRFIAGGLHPDHDTIAHFRKRFLNGYFSAPNIQGFEQLRMKPTLPLARNPIIKIGMPFSRSSQNRPMSGLQIEAHAYLVYPTVALLARQ